MDDITCRKCTKGNSPEATFCMHCGTKLVSGNVVLPPFSVLRVSDQADLTPLKKLLLTTYGVEDLESKAERWGIDLSTMRARIEGLTHNQVRQAVRGMTSKSARPHKIAHLQQAFIRAHGLDGRPSRTVAQMAAEVGAKYDTTINGWRTQSWSYFLHSLRRVLGQEAA